MNRAIILAGYLLLLTTSVRIFLFGGILVNDDNLAYKKLAEATGKPTRLDCDKNWFTTDCPKVAVITSACPDSQCGYEQYNVGDEEQAATGPFFASLGMAPLHVNVHVDNYEWNTDILTQKGEKYYQILEAADIIYFNGGDQSRHIRCWFNDDGYPNAMFAAVRRRVLNNDVILVGVSAGTAVQSKTIYGGGSPFGILYFSNLVGLAPNSISSGNGLNDVRNGTDCLQYEQNGAKLPGFGFINEFQIDTHFDIRGRLGRLVPILSDIKTAIGVGIDEFTCFYYNDGVGTVYGSRGVFIADISSALKPQSHYYQIKNVKVHYLTEGDSFNLKSRTVHTSKKIIPSPSQSGFVDSDNILGAYEATRLMTRLVDQKGVFNEGKTRIPPEQDYPESTPKFSLTFFKGQDTHGYRQGDKFTCENVYLDISAETRQ